MQLELTGGNRFFNYGKGFMGLCKAGKLKQCL